MTQSRLDREVARATGESVEVIRRRGFSIVEPHDQHDDVLPAPNVVDWDERDAQRVVLFPQSYGRRAMAA